MIAIYNTEGDLQCKYNYDAWGNHRVGNARNELIYDSATGVIATGYESHIAILNPIRYRGYYYDTETGPYYLQSRYYDATLCRFLNRDNVNYLEPESIHGLNLYAYCNNNPVIFADPSGNSVIAILLILAAATFIGAGLGVKKAASEGKKGWSLVKDVILCAAIGLAVGGAFVSLGAVFTGAIFGAKAAFLGVVAKQAFAIGALAFDFTAYVIAPLFGIAMQGIEYESQESPYKPPYKTPTQPHPAAKDY